MTFKKSVLPQVIKKNMFPQICDEETLLVDTNLNGLRLLTSVPKTVSTKKKIRISFELSIHTSTANVFLLINGQKTDMFYSVTSGKYLFYLYLNQGKNTVEIFYVINSSKSPSVFRTFFKR